jgi:hypothetical protein
MVALSGRLDDSTQRAARFVSVSCRDGFSLHFWFLASRRIQNRRTITLASNWIVTSPPSQRERQKAELFAPR